MTAEALRSTLINIVIQIQTRRFRQHKMIQFQEKDSVGSWLSNKKEPWSADSSEEEDSVLFAEEITHTRNGHGVQVQRQFDAPREGSPHKHRSSYFFPPYSRTRNGEKRTFHYIKKQTW